MKVYAISSRYPQYTREVRPKKEIVYVPPSYPDNNVIDFQVAKAYMNTQAISFGYSSILKDLFKEGKMPSVTHGIYGNPIDKATVSLEHLRAKSYGGQNTLSNYALAHIKANSMRGNMPLPYFLNNEMLENYLSQFNFEIKGKFSGYKYQDMIRETCKRLGVGEELRDKGFLSSALILPETKIVKVDYGNLKDVISHIDEIDINMLSKKMLKSLKNRGYI